MNVNKININQTEPTYYIASDIYDVSAHNNSATFESLSALLSDENLSTLIPSEIRCGGMTIRFVQSSDNKYVQYRLMTTSFSTDTNQWQGVDELPVAGSKNLVESGGALDFVNDNVSYVGVNDNSIPYIERNGYMRRNNTFSDTELYHCKYTQFKCKAGDIYKYKGRGVAEAYSWIVFDENGIIIDTGQVNSETSYYEVLVITGGASIKFSSFKEIESPVILEVFKKGGLFDDFKNLETNVNVLSAEVQQLDQKVDDITEYGENQPVPIEFTPTFGSGWVYNNTTNDKLLFRNTTTLDYGFIKIDVSEFSLIYKIVVTNISALKSKTDGINTAAVFVDNNDIVLSVFCLDNQPSAMTIISDAEYMVPLNAKYCYLNVSHSQSPTVNIITKRVLLSGVKDVIDVGVHVDVYDNVEVTPESYGIKRDGTPGSDSQYNHASIEVSKGDVFRLSGASYWNYPFFLFKDSRENVVSCYPATYETTNITPELNIIFTAPLNGTLIVNLNLDNNYVNNGSTIEKVSYSYVTNKLKEEVVTWENLSKTLQNRINDGNSKLLGKTIYNDGDSVARGASFGATHEISYAEQIAEIFNMQLTHAAVSGTTLGYRTDETSIPERMMTNLNGNDYDYILFQGGFNDCGHNIPLGTISSGFDAVLDPYTTIGALETVCKWLMINKPTAKKLFVLCHKWQYDRQKPYWDAIIDVLEKWGIPYVDIWRETQLYGINQDFKDAWFYHNDGVHGDGLHPNTLAYTTFYVDKIISALESI